MSTNRRKFLKIFGVIPFGAWLFGRTDVAGAAAGKSRQFILNRFSVAGFQYYDGPDIVHRLNATDEIIRQVDCGRGRADEFVRRKIQGVDPCEFRPGCRLDLRAEPDNPHDSFAVEIHFQKAKLGYVPRSDNKHISRLLQQGASLDCKVISIAPGAGFCNMVRVEVGMQG